MFNFKNYIYEIALIAKENNIDLNSARTKFINNIINKTNENYKKIFNKFNQTTERDRANSRRELNKIIKKNELTVKNIIDLYNNNRKKYNNIFDIEENIINIPTIKIEKNEFSQIQQIEKEEKNNLDIEEW